MARGKWWLWHVVSCGYVDMGFALVVHGECGMRLRGPQKYHDIRNISIDNGINRLKNNC